MSVEAVAIQGNLWLKRYSYFVCFMVLMLILKGALVTSNDAGLAVPDWPNSFGENMFLFHPSKWTGIIFYEHVHRLLASFIGLLTVILCLWLLIKEKRKWVKVLGVLSVVLVILQGVLGGLTVLYLLPTSVSSAHAVLAQSFFILMIVIAYSQSQEFREKQASTVAQPTKKAFDLAVSFIGAIYIQLIIGAIMRHSWAGLAVPDFPTMGGQYLPGFGAEFLDAVNSVRTEMKLPLVDGWQVSIHLMHRFFAVLVVLSFLPFFAYVMKNVAPITETLKRAKRLTGLLSLVLLTQFCLGIFTIWTGRNAWVASIHVMLGALLLGLSVLVALRLYPQKRTH